jgi:putative transposase
VLAGSWCPIAANQRWSLDFTEDCLANGRRFRTANLKDDCTRECPAIAVDFSLPGQRVVGMLEDVARERGYPDMLVVDNGPELRGRELDRWAHDHGVRLFFIDPGKPMQNASIESFNGRFREECLDQSWFTSLTEARRVIEAWRVDYNEQRPHTSLRMRTPAAFAAARPFAKPRRSGPHRTLPRPMSLAESGVRRNIPGPCGNALAANGNSGWGDVGRDASDVGGEGAAGRVQGRGAEPAGDRGPARPGRLDGQPRAAAQRAAQGRLPAGPCRGLLP